MQKQNGFEAEILCDSVCNGVRLTTFRLRYPRFILAEINTHRVFSRSSASSRAVPAKKYRAAVLRDPAMPIHWGRNQKGMQAKAELAPWKAFLARSLWRLARYPALLEHALTNFMGLHKQVCNRGLERWIWCETVLSSTEFRNFFLLRDHPDAQPEFGFLANLMRLEYGFSSPTELQPGDWHLPYVTEEEKQKHTLFEQKVISTARCCRVSYYLPETKLKSMYGADLITYQRLVGSHPIHSSPAEHLAQAMGNFERYGNFVGFRQHRKELKGENGGDYEYTSQDHGISRYEGIRISKTNDKVLNPEQ